MSGTFFLANNFFWVGWLVWEGVFCCLNWLVGLLFCCSDMVSSIPAWLCLNSWILLNSSCLYLPSAGILGVCHVLGLCTATNWTQGIIVLGKHSANLASSLALSQINSASLSELYRPFPSMGYKMQGGGKHYSDEISLESLLPCAVLFGCC